MQYTKCYPIIWIKSIVRIFCPALNMCSIKQFLYRKAAYSAFPFIPLKNFFTPNFLSYPNFSPSPAIFNPLVTLTYRPLNLFHELLVRFVVIRVMLLDNLLIPLENLIDLLFLYAS
jgi:hypothetical protein